MVWVQQGAVREAARRTGSLRVVFDGELAALLYPPHDAELRACAIGLRLL